MITHKLTIDEADGSKTNTFRNDRYFAMITSYHRGGCLFTGDILLKEWSTGKIKNIGTVLESTGSNSMALYLQSLCQKHFEN